MQDEIIYSISIEDLYKVSEEELGRKLTLNEIEKITNDICEKIPWYNIIAEAISEKITD